MLYYDRIDISEAIDLAKNNNSKKYMIYHYCLFFSFLFQDSACKRCHYLTILCLNISDITIITVKNVGYRFIIHDIKKYCLNF